ncbi:MAG: GNAT family N-acetyltransferase [Treponema sp.]|nr:GNAT family N-acetyltransferase [Treponema sp.]
MNVLENKITLKPLKKEDVNTFIKWLNKEYIYKRLCPGGEEEKQAWLHEVNNTDGKYNHFKYFIVNYNGIKIGCGLFVDIYYEQEYLEKNYGIIVNKNSVYEIGYFIGEEEFLNKGIGKIIVKKLEEKIVEIEGKEILADPEPVNIPSIKVLLSNGFVKIKDCDYRKKLK